MNYGIKSVTFCLEVFRKHFPAAPTAPGCVLACAGSYRIEGLGIALFDELSLPDFTGVVGLPLLAVVRLLSLVEISPLD